MRFYALLFAAILSLGVCRADDPLPPPYCHIEVLPMDPQGWFHVGNARQLEKLFEENEIYTVVEVGSWLGKSTRWFAERVEDGGRVYAVDHWKGSSEHQPGAFAYREVVHVLYQQFLSNVIHAGLTDRIVPVRMESAEAALALNVDPDLIYIDASHEYELVLRDLELWYPHVGEQTIFCGDDWVWKGVQRAVKEFAATHGLKVVVDPDVGRNFWQLVRP